MSVRPRNATPRVLPSLALAGAAILVAAGIVVSIYQDDLFRAQRFREVTVQGRILAESVTAALSFGDKETAQEYVDALKINPEIEAVGVYDAHRAAFAGFVRAGARPIPNGARADAAGMGDDRLAVLLPVRQDNADLGTVYVRAIVEPKERRLARYAAIMLLAVMSALLLTVMGTAQRTLRRVNRELQDQADALGESNRRLHQEMGEREKVEEALRQSQKMEAVGQLSGGVAHDFNNLLSIIKGNLQLLQKRLTEGRDVARYIESANKGVDRASNLTRRLLAFSRRQPLSPRPVNLSDLASGVTDLIFHSVGERVRIEWTLESRWLTLCDFNQMENVILNLAINARDAMPDGGTLSIATRDIEIGAPKPPFDEAPPGSYVELRLTDTGTGMSDEVRSRAIDPFFTTKPQGQGTGLGLSMTFGFIRQSNGHMAIESAPGVGTAIIILMPRYESVKPEASA